MKKIIGIFIVGVILQTCNKNEEIKMSTGFPEWALEITK